MYVSAQQRSESEAMEIAQEFFASKGKAPKLSVVSHKKIEANLRKKVATTLNATQNGTSYYVVNDDTNDRFVIVSADERMYTILGYSDNGTFDAETAPEGLLFLMSGYDSQADLLSQYGENMQTNNKRKATKAIQPLITARWDQDLPFNAYCPIYNSDTLCVTGCVATAMAQAMNYYKYPSTGMGGTVTYKTRSLGVYESFDYNSLTLDWDYITDTYNSYSTEKEKNEVAKLMHACGVSVFMDYGKSSGANPGTIPYALINNFGYNKNMQYVVKDYYESEEWNMMIRTELEAGRPIIYGGSGSVGGHQFILDGMDNNGLYHFNFGWSGNHDGYFSVDAINFKMRVAPNTYINVDFNAKQGMIVGFTPETNGIPQDVFYTTTLKIDTIVNINDLTTVTYNPYCCCNLTNDYDKNFKGTFGIGLFNNEFQMIQPLAENKKLSGSAGSWGWFNSNISFRYDSDIFKEGSQYYIALYAQHEQSSTPTLVRTPMGAQDWYRATVMNGKVYLERKKLIDGETPVIHEDPVYPPGILGLFDVTALDKSGEGVNWQVSVSQDLADSTKYYFKDIDPVVKKLGFTSENGYNTVYGFMNTEGNIRIPMQEVGTNLYFDNYTSDDSITVLISRQDNKMMILNTWGTIERTSGSSGAEQNNKSYYSATTFLLHTTAPVIVPSINVDENHLLSISSATEGASLYYTTDGTTPTSNSSLYENPIQLKKNCTIKAIAIKDGNISDVATLNYNKFKVETPTITVEDNIISISVSTTGTKIYYTTDGNNPTSKSTKYTTPFTCETTATIKAIAIKNGWNNSDIASYYHVVPPKKLDVVITNNVAGELPTKISDSDKLNVASLKVSGQLNGTDIKFIREMTIDGILTYLDLEESSIVSGGEPYYQAYTSSYLTEDNIIGTNMFAYCDKLNTLILPQTVTKMNMYAIFDCDNLKEIKIPRDCTEIKQAIAFCENIEEVYINAGLVKFETSSFFACPSLKEIIVDENNPSFCSVDGVMFNKNKTTIVRFPASGPNSYTIPNSVNTIGEHAFYDTNIISINIPTSVKTIENGAFCSCENLESIVIPNSVSKLGRSSFYYCSKLASIELSSQLTKIESSTFTFCRSLKSINIGANVTTIDTDAFNYCSSLQQFVIDDNNPVYCSEGGLLYLKDKKTIVRCPEGVYAETFNVSDEVEIIGDFAFMRCQNIKNIILPKSLRTIGNYSFDACMMELIQIPDDVSQIGHDAFSYCDNLKTAVIPNATTTIPHSSFISCDSLSFVKIHAGITEIERSAFRFCRALKTICCEVEDANSLIVEDLAFDEIPSDCNWRIPYGCVDAYKSQPWWVNTWRIVEEDFNPNIPYVVYNSGILTFYRDGKENSRKGDVYTNLILSGSSDKWGEHKQEITKVVIDPSFASFHPTSTKHWFNGLKNVTSIEGLNYLNTSEVVSMYAMFNGFSQSSKTVTELDLSGFDTKKVTNMNYMFNCCPSIRTIYVSDSWNTDRVTNSNNMFMDCKNLIGNYGTTYDPNNIDKTVAHAKAGGYLTHIPVPYATYNNGTLTFYYDNQQERRSGDIYSNLVRKKAGDQWGAHRTEIKKVVFTSSFSDANPTSTAHWFNGCTSLTSITGLQYLNTSVVSNMYAMFNGCTALFSVDVSNFDTSKVKNMSYTFNCCSLLTDLDLKSFDTSKVTNMNYMFNSCKALQTIEVGSKWNTSNVTNSANMFTGCKKLMGSDATRYKANVTDKSAAHTGEHGYLTGSKRAYAVYEDGILSFYYDNNWSKRTGDVYTYLIRTKSSDLWGTHKADIAKVVFHSAFAETHPGSLYHWFNGFTALTTIRGIENLNTDEVTSMYATFNGCKLLTTLDISGFDTSCTASMGYMFNSCSKLKTIYVGDGWDTSSVKSSANMFYGCKVLVGGDGTKYDSNYIDQTKAFAGKGGYMTYKSASVKELNDTDFAATAIESVEEEKSNEIYNIQGICVGTTANMKILPKGVYIIGGKKVVLR